MGILEDRQKTHGDFAKVARTTANLGRLLGFTSARYTPAQDTALLLIATKLARIVNGDPNVIDHWRDIAGYAELVVRDLQRQGVADMSSDDTLNVTELLQNFEARWIAREYGQ
jgi:hypothetical protein